MKKMENDKKPWRIGECLICGEPIFVHGRETPIYCRKHRSHAQHDSEILQNITIEETFRIATAILIRARDDYILNADNQRSDAEVFFRSNWAQIITNGELNADELLKELDRCAYEFREFGKYPERTQRE